jgi:hypothetical protein
MLCDIYDLTRLRFAHLNVLKTLVCSRMRLQTRTDEKKQGKKRPETYSTTTPFDFSDSR